MSMEDVSNYSPQVDFPFLIEKEEDIVLAINLDDDNETLVIQVYEDVSCENIKQAPLASLIDWLLGTGVGESEGQKEELRGYKKIILRELKVMYAKVEARKI